MKNLETNLAGGAWERPMIVPPIPNRSLPKNKADALPAIGFTKAGLPRQRRSKSFKRTREQIKKERQRRYCAARRLQFNRDGLTTKGRAYVNHFWKELSRLGLHGKAREAERRRCIREANKRQGLTVRGTIRIRQQWPAELRDLPKRERNRILCNDWLWRNRYSKGLTATGTVPLHQQKSSVQMAWETFRSGINVGIVSVEDFNSWEQHREIYT